MKTYYGNYLGLVISNSDPEYRGRVQVFVPHIMPTLYEGWNKEGKDIQINCVGSNVPEGLTPEIHARLVQILPWAEAASPIIGSSSPGNLFTDFLGGVKNAAGAVVDAATGALNNFFYQGPTSQPIPVEGGDASALIDKAKGITNLDYNPDPDSATNSKGKQWGMCARGTVGIHKAAGLVDNNGPSAGFDAAKDLSAGRSNRTGYNPYTQGTGAKYFEKPFTFDNSKIQTNPTTGKKNIVGAQVGDAVFSDGGGGNGHAQTLVGIDKNGDQIWYSDNPQNSGFFDKSREGDYFNHTVYRLNQQGLAKYTAAIGGKITGQEPPSTTNTEQTADSSPAAANPLAKKDASTTTTAPQPQTTMVAGGPDAGTPIGTISGGGTASNINTSNMSPAFKAQYERVYASLEGTKFASMSPENAPKDGATFGVNTGSREEWAHLFTRLASVESSFNPNVQADINGIQPGQRGFNGQVRSFGLYQLGGTKTDSWGFYGQGNILDPNDNTKAFVKYAEDLYFGDKYYKSFGGNNVIAGISPDGKPLGIAGGFGPLRNIAKGSPTPNQKQLLGANMTAAEQQTGNYTGTVAAADPLTLAPSVVNNTDDNGRTPVLNTNDMPNGMFAYPNPGAMVWVFFREGNPLFPVYFAASYSATEWKNAYRGGSEGDLMSHGENDPSTKITSSVMKLHPAATILAKEKVSLSNPQDNESVFSLCHQHGSNVTFKNGCDFYYSRNNKRDEVDNDRFILTKGYKEEWTEGDASTNTRGNLIVKVGNISQEAIDAMNELADMSYEMNQTLMEKPKS